VPAKKETMTIAHESQHRFFFYAGKISFYFPFYLIFFSLAESRNENTETQTLVRFNCCAEEGLKITTMAGGRGTQMEDDI
jgi:hypothetical protein